MDKTRNLFLKLHIFNQDSPIHIRLASIDDVYESNEGGSIIHVGTNNYHVQEEADWIVARTNNNSLQ